VQIIKKLVTTLYQLLLHRFSLYGREAFSDVSPSVRSSLADSLSGRDVGTDHFVHSLKMFFL